MSLLGDFFKTKKPKPVTSVPAAAPAEKKPKKAALLALRATGPGGALSEKNVGRKKILV